jgi:chemotaxis protein histidine kinase CheA
MSGPASASEIQFFRAIANPSRLDLSRTDRTDRTDLDHTDQSNPPSIAQRDWQTESAFNATQGVVELPSATDRIQVVRLVDDSVPSREWVSEPNRQAEAHREAEREAQREAERQAEARREAERQAEARREAERQAEAQREAEREAQREAERQEEAHREAHREAQQEAQREADLRRQYEAAQHAYEAEEARKAAEEQWRRTQQQAEEQWRRSQEPPPQHIPEPQPDLSWETPTRDTDTRYKAALLEALKQYEVDREFTMADDVADLQMTLNYARQKRHMGDTTNMLRGGVLLGCFTMEQGVTRLGKPWLEGYTRHMSTEIEKEKYNTILQDIYRKYLSRAGSMDPILSLCFALLWSAIVFAMGGGGRDTTQAEPVNRVRKRSLRPPRAEADPNEAPPPTAPPAMDLGGLMGGAAPLLKTFMGNPSMMQGMMQMMGSM